MKKFTQWVDVIREAEESKQSELQKSYKDYFSAKLNKFGAKSPADLDAEQKAEFFNEIKKDWEKGSGAKPAGKKDVEEHGVKESVNEASQEEQIKKEVISKLSDFFGCAPGNLAKFNFDGKDNIKELTKALRSTSDEGTAQYYRIAIIMAKRDLGIHESKKVDEGFNNYGWFLRLPKKVIANELRSATSNLTKYFNNASAGQDLQQDVLEDIISELENVKNQLKKFSKGEKPTGVYESEEVNEAVINEAVATPEELASFIQKEEKHFAAFLKPKKLTATVNGKVVTIKPGSGSFTITVDYAKSTIDTTGKPEWPESTSYVELMEYIKITKFKLNESTYINEGKKEDLTKQLEVIFAQIKSMNLEKSAELAFTKTGLAFGFLDMLSKPGAIKNLQDKSPEAKQRIKDAHSALTGANSSDEIKSILVGLIDSVNESAIFEADIKNAADFKEYATTVLKKQHGDKFDEKVADKVIKGLSDEAEKSGDWGAAVGKLNA
jgi:hypothetical protein